MDKEMKRNASGQSKQANDRFAKGLRPRNEAQEVASGSDENPAKRPSALEISTRLDDFWRLIVERGVERGMKRSVKRGVERGVKRSVKRGV